MSAVVEGRGINNGDVEQAESLSVMLRIIYYLHRPVREVGVLRTQGYRRRMAVSELESTYSFYDLSHLYTLMSRQGGVEEK